MRSVTRGMLSRPLPSHQKLAEKLVILNNRLDGMVTRIYNIKKACGDPRSKPSFLTEKSLESAVKFIVRKFPQVDIRNHQNQLAAVNNSKNEILKGLSIYYYTFVDVMEFKDHISEILTTVDSLGIHFDITLCFDLTSSYLNMIVRYVSLLILMSRIDERKAIIGLYNHAHDMLQGKTDKDFPRLAQMIQDYDNNPLKKLVDDFSVHHRSIHQALMSLMQVYPQRNLSSENWRQGSLFSIISTPNQMLNPAQTEKMPCEYLSIESMEKWIYFGYLLCHSALQNSPDASQALWKPVLQNNFCISLFRDEVLMLHRTAEEIFSSLKGFNKVVAEVRQCREFAAQNAGKVHMEKRKFLRTAMKELVYLISDQPGLLGPKTLFVFMSLAYSRDEVLWLVRHAGNLVKKANPEDFVDRFLGELMFHMEEMRQLVRSYDEVIQRYYVQYLYGYDAVVLNETVQNLSVCPEDESVIMTSVVNTMTSLSIKQVEQKELFDFRGLRLDWFRLQAYTSVSKAALLLKDNQPLGRLMNSIVFHCRMVDDLDEMLRETSDLSDLCFFPTTLVSSFKRCLEHPGQCRYSISFPLVCAHFQSALSEFCPEERLHIRDRATNYVTTFLDDMSREARNLLFGIADEQCILSDQVLAKNAGSNLRQDVRKKGKGKKGAKTHITESKAPGIESFRKDRLHVTKLDKYHLSLAEICAAINYRQTFVVWDHTFSPKEFLTAQLESKFSKTLVALTFNKDTNTITKPSELLSRTKAYMSVIQTIENYVHIDATRIFNSVLLQQTQMQDSHGESTVTNLYTQWYLEVLLRQVSNGNSTVFSEIRKAFVQVPGTESSSNATTINPEEFSNITELRALADMIGPYGMKNLNENLAWHVAVQINELKKLVAQNRETLNVLRTNFDKPEQMAVHYRRLDGVESVLLRMTIIGMILYFRSATQDALNDVLERRIPFLLSSITDFKEHIPKETDIKVNITISELASAAGIRCDVDPALCRALESHKGESGEEEHKLACLLMVFLAVSIPVLARDEGSLYKPELGAHGNSCHCIAFAVNRVASALFTINGGNIAERLTEFLALASSSLLKLGLETDRASTRNRDSVYLLLEQIVKDSSVLTMDLLESCFPYVLLRNSYHAVRVQTAGASAIGGQTSPSHQNLDNTGNA